jgi:hypothetical protein
MRPAPLGARIIARNRSDGRNLRRARAVPNDRADRSHSVERCPILYVGSAAMHPFGTLERLIDWVQGGA